MLTHLHVENYRALQEADIALFPLTVFVGENSSGKSTALQAVLLALLATLEKTAQRQQYEEVLNKILLNPLSLDSPASSEVNIRADADCSYALAPHAEGRGHEPKTGLIRLAAPAESTTSILLTRENGLVNASDTVLFPHVVYLGADRIGPRATYPVTPLAGVGIRGENAIPYLDRVKNSVPEEALLHEGAEDETLLGQVNYWLRYIVDTSVKTEGSSSGAYVEAKYSHGRPDADVSPLQTGVGTSLVLPVILACLSARPGGLLLLENPEIHLHPRAQARLAALFAFVVKAGVQLMVETHCEHMAYKLCHLVFRKELGAGDLIFHYKEKVDTPFVPIYVNERGRFVNAKGEPEGFPSGFFDATLQDYLSMYM